MSFFLVTIHYMRSFRQNSDRSLFVFKLQRPRKLPHSRRMIRLIEGNEKCCHLKNWPVKGLCDRCLYLSEVQNPIPTPPPPYTLCMYTCIQYTYSQREGGELRELNQREGKRCNSSQSWVENANMKACISLQSINSDKQLSQSSFTCQFFRWRHFAVVSMRLISPCS
jgi:hypothetical protein